VEKINFGWTESPVEENVSIIQSGFREFVEPQGRRKRKSFMLEQIHTKLSNRQFF
jgi:hypothetical protein